MREIKIPMNGRMYQVSWNGRLGGPETLVEVWVAETTFRNGQHRHGHWRRVREMGYDDDMWQRAVDRAWSELGKKETA